MTDFNRSLLLATAAWSDLIATPHQMQAATLRGDKASANIIRQRAHDMLDACLDLNAQAAVALRVAIGG